MKKGNGSTYFTRVEDKFVFRVSTAFWHFLIGIITVAAVIGVLLLVWSIIPPGKTKIKAATYPTKAAYPPVEKVTLADLSIDEVKMPPPPEFQQAPPPPESRPQRKVESDPDRPAYDLLLAELKRIIPKDQWQPGFWSYPYGELAWQMHPSDPNYKHWNQIGDDVEQRLERSYNVLHAQNYAVKKSALTSYMKIIKQVDPVNSCEVLNTIMGYMNDRYSDLHILDSTFTLIAKNLRTFSGSKEAAQHLIIFSLNHPETTLSFMPFAFKTCVKFPDSIRLNMLTSLSSGLYRYFNADVEVQKDATEQFQKLLPQLHGVAPVKALNKFYSVYNRKNQKRNEAIGRINEDYNTQITAIIADSTMKAAEAEMKYIADKEKKSEWRSKSGYAVIGGFVGIALLGTILTLLSIQRILRRMESIAEIKSL